MTLSIIIVNYNVKYFLEQCLYSVQLSSKKIKTEVFIVDNNSVDGSVEMVESKFSEYKLIKNKKNVGFSRANNQAIKKAKGKYILLLNPDTLLEEDTLNKCILFMKRKENIGGLGVKMIDGNGNFLPESKRSFPSPIIAFYKIFGLSYIFPKSKNFGQYHLSYLDKNKTHEVDVLSGAFFLIKKNIVKKVGLLDEKFFMYGEDIDLSYRIKNAGYKNYYFPKTKIIHYKGESTKKGSMNYVYLFYKAMSIFSNKHFKGKNALFFYFIIHFAIYFRATISVLKRFFDETIYTLVDIMIIYFGSKILKVTWEKHSLSLIGEQKILPNEFMNITVPVCIAVSIFFIFINGGYEKYVKINKIIKGTLIASIIILIIYALLPEEYRISRTLIVLNLIWTIFSLTLYRKILGIIGISNFKKIDKKIAIIGDEFQFKKVKNLIEKTINEKMKITHINCLKISSEKDFKKLKDEIIKSINIHSINEIIFCSKNISFNHIIKKISFLNKYNMKIKIVPEGGKFIIGSDSKNSKGELYTLKKID